MLRTDLIFWDGCFASLANSANCHDSAFAESRNDEMEVDSAN
ncbi:hypothetical protein ACWIUD_11905 [Helicobacter sp. 23-1044]